MKKQIPKFKNEAEEREFWQKNDSSEFIDWTSGKNVVVPNLKPSYKNISLRLPASMYNDLKSLANKKDVPYQSLIKMIISEKLEEYKA